MFILAILNAIRIASSVDRARLVRDGTCRLAVIDMFRTGAPRRQA